MHPSQPRPSRRRPIRALLLAGALSLLAAPAATAASGTKSFETGGRCTIAGDLSVKGTMPANVAPGESFDVTITAITVGEHYFTPLPTPGGPKTVGSVSGTVGVTLQTDGAVSPTAAPESAVPYGPQGVQYSYFWSTAAQLPAGGLKVGPIVADAEGSPIVLRFGGATIRNTFSPNAGEPISSTRDCAATREPLGFISSGGPVPGTPVVTSISPDVVPATGGTEITLKGDHLASVYSISQAGSAVEVIDDHTVTFKSREFLYGGGTDGFAEGLRVDTDFGSWTSPTNDALIAYKGTTPPAQRPKRPTITGISGGGTLSFGQTIALTGTGLGSIESAGFADSGTSSTWEAPFISTSSTSLTLTTAYPYEVPSATVRPVVTESRYLLSSDPATTPALRWVDAASGGAGVPGTPVVRFGGFSRDSTFVDWPRPASSSEITGYEVYLDGKLYRGFLLNNIPSTGPLTERIEVRPSAPGRHTITVRARDAAGRASALSAPLTIDQPATFPQPASGLTPEVTPSAASAQVTWPGGGASEEEVDLLLDGRFLKTVPGAAGTTRLDGLTPGRTYRLQLIVRGADGFISDPGYAQFTTAAVGAPVITRVTGRLRAGAGGLLLISGSRLKGVKSVTIAGVKARVAVPVGTQLLVLAPRLPEGYHQLVVTNAAGPNAGAGPYVLYEAK